MKKKNPQNISASALLAAAPLFSSFSPGELDFLAEKSEFLGYDDGTPIFASGTTADRLYLVAEGVVVIRAPGGGSVLAEYVAGDSFGELDFLTGAAHNAEALASGPTTLLAFPAGGAGLRDALSARPEVAARILRSFLLVIAGRTRVSNAW
jgi:CRP-like cAMP-binding protein